MLAFVQQFMIDVLVEYGVPEDEAKQAGDVLITADKRGIDSHGIGRLKPIYCDRIKQGILKPTAPITVVAPTTETVCPEASQERGVARASCSLPGMTGSVQTSIHLECSGAMLWDGVV